MPWIRARVALALLRSALLCLRGSRAKRRISVELSDIDFDIETRSIPSFKIPMTTSLSTRHPQLLILIKMLAIPSVQIEYEKGQVNNTWFLVSMVSSVIDRRNS